MRFVYHCNDEIASILIDGRLITIPPDEPFEVPEIRGTDCNNNGPYEYVIPDHQVAKKIVEHGWYHGIVEITMVKTKTGINADVAGARQQAMDALQTAEDRILTQYVSDQQERVSRYGKAAIAPNGRVATIIAKRGIDLKKEFNIDPPGYGLAKTHDRDAEMADMKRQLAELQAALTEKTHKGK